MLHKIENYILTININNNYSDIYKYLIDKFYSDKDASIYKINFIFYDKFNIEPLSYESTKKLCKERIGQTKFRNDLIEFYNNCIISEDDHEQCQACHIIPYSETKLNHIDNGLLLNYNLHHLFDSFYIGLQYIDSFNNKFDKYKVILSKKIKFKQSYKNYIIYDNKIININKNSKQFLDIIYQQFLDHNSN